MKQRHRKKSRLKRKLGKEQVSHYFSLALSIYKSNKKLADRYISYAKKIAMKCKVKFSSHQRRLVCGHCGVLLVPGRNCRVRITGKTISYFCYECRNFTRLGYKRTKENQQGHRNS